MTTVRRLGPEDAPVLQTLARDAARFDIAGRSEAVPALDQELARAYLSNADILHWVAEHDGLVVGFVLCYLQRLWHAPGREVMLYDIGVHEAYRRQGIGRMLIETMESWMRENDVADVWVPADNIEAEAFYRACGFARDDEQAVIMSKRVRDASKHVEKR